MHSPRPLRFLILLLSIALAIPGSSFRAAAAQDYWVYFGTFTDGSSKGIYVSRLSADGQLTVPELAATNDRPVFLVADHKHRFLYAANETKNFQDTKGGSASAFAMDAKTGKLTALNQSSAVAPGPDHIDIDATGREVIVANYDGSSVTSFPVKSDGSLGPAGSFIEQHGSSVNPTRQNKPHAHSVTVDPGNHFALICDLGLDQVLVFKMNPGKGELTPNDPPFAAVAPGSGPRHLAFHPGGKFAYVISEISCTMTAFSFDPKLGKLTELQTLSTLPPGETVKTNDAAAEVIVHPSGKFVYGSTRGRDTITVFSIDQKTGTMTFVESVPCGGKIPRNFNIDPSGRFLLSANQDSGNITVFSIDVRTGRLTSTGAKADLNKPVCILFVPVH